MRKLSAALWVALSLLSCTAHGAPGTLYVARRGWHIDIGYATQDLREPLRSIARNFPQATFVFLGFGDRHYLDDEKNQHGPAMLAALWPGPGIVLVTTLESLPATAFGRSGVVELPASEAQLQASQDYVWKSLIVQGDRVDIYRPGPYDGAYYFRALPTYSALNTCNTWAAHALRAAGFPVHARGVLFAGQLWVQMRRVQRRIKIAAPAS